MNNIHAGFLFSMLMLLFQVSFAQEQPSLRDRADELYSRYEFAKAVKLYARLVDTPKPRFHDMERLAESYWKMNDYESAENWYARVVQHPQSSPENRLRYGEVLKVNGKYAEAKSQLEAYANDAPHLSSYLAAQVAGCDSALWWLANPTQHKVVGEEYVNTDLSEFSPFLAGGRMYFTGEPADKSVTEAYGWTGKAFLRIFSAPLSDGKLIGGPSLADNSFNTGEYHVGPLSADKAGNTLFVTRTYAGKNPAREQEGRRRFLTRPLELHIYQRAENGWVSEPFPYNNVKEYSVGHAALSMDGLTLYFASDMPGGYGGTDIWYSERQTDGKWGTPINAGPVVNSAGDELFPTIGPDGSLYFSSDGFPGMGGLDIFKSVGKKTQWSAPENLRYPINSASDDFAYVIAEENETNVRGFLSSDRRGGKGDDDIYSFRFEKPKLIILLQGTASDKKSGDRLPGTSVTLYDGKRILLTRKQSDTNGAFEFILDQDMDYTIIGQKSGYHADSVKVSTRGIRHSDTLEVALLLEPVFKVGQTFELEKIYYDFDQYSIRPDAAEVLDELVRTMRDNPSLKIELSSHTDSRGSHAYNDLLSQRRAQSAVDYLIVRGIARDRVVAKGYGETKPVNRCVDGVACSAAEHQANRRTEVTVLAY